MVEFTIAWEVLCLRLTFFTVLDTIMTAVYITAIGGPGLTMNECMLCYAAVAYIQGISRHIRVWAMRTSG